MGVQGYSLTSMMYYLKESPLLGWTDCHISETVYATRLFLLYF